MSIPERVWRIVKGRWVMAGDQLRSLEEKLAEADAYQELADALRVRPEPGTVPTTTARTGSTVLPEPPAPTAAGQHDPLEAAYELLQVKPGAGLAEVDAAYNERMSELRPELTVPGTPERTTQDARRRAVEAAYDKVRDVLNPTETRFERLEI